MDTAILAELTTESQRHEKIILLASIAERHGKYRRDQDQQTPDAVVVVHANSSVCGGSRAG